MTRSKTRVRIEIDASTYDMLERYASFLRIPTQRCATMLLTDLLRSKTEVQSDIDLKAQPYRIPDVVSE